jgi:hypothetical protein
MRLHGMYQIWWARTLNFVTFIPKFWNDLQDSEGEVRCP